MYAKILKDVLFHGRSGVSAALSKSMGMTDRTGQVLIGDETAKDDDVQPVRLLDDDREVYYEGEADSEGMEPLFEWAIQDSGVTILQTQDHYLSWIDTLN